MKGVGPKLRVRGARQRSDAPGADDLDDIFAPDWQPGMQEPRLSANGDAESPDGSGTRSAAPPSSLRLRRALRRAGATRLHLETPLPDASRELPPPPPVPQLEYRPASRKRPTKPKRQKRSDWRVGALAALAGILWGSGLAYLAYSYMTGEVRLAFSSTSSGPLVQASQQPAKPAVAPPAPTVVAEAPATTPKEIQKSQDSISSEQSDTAGSSLPAPVAPPGGEANVSSEVEASAESAGEAVPTTVSPEQPVDEGAAEKSAPIELPIPAPPKGTDEVAAATSEPSVPVAPASGPEESTAEPVVPVAPVPTNEAVPTSPVTTKQEVAALQSPSTGERTVEGPIVDCEQCPQLISVPPGQFLMGSTDSEPNHQSDEGPQHPVTFARPFAISTHEVTFEEWDACVKDGACQQSPSDEGWGRGKNPVINVSWDEVTRQYLPWLSKKTGQTYRLPTEAEWEYAARGGAASDASSTFSFGDNGNDLCTYGNGADETAKEINGGGEAVACNDGHAKTASVGSFKPNALGLYDTHGNVWEWVEDCWNDTYSNAAVDGSASTTGDCSTRVLRGGSWNSDVANLRTAARGWNRSGGRNSSIGFRVVRDF